MAINDEVQKYDPYSDDNQIDPQMWNDLLIQLYKAAQTMNYPYFYRDTEQRFTLEAMEMEGLVESSGSPDDRAVQYMLTAEGMNEAQALGAKAQKSSAESLAAKLDEKIGVKATKQVDQDQYR